MSKRAEKERRSNVRSYRFFQFRKKLSKVIAFVLILCTLMLAIGIGTIIYIDSVRDKEEVHMMKENGLFNPTRVDDDREINITIHGDELSKHTLVPISSVGVQDFNVFISHIIGDVGDDTRIALIDRAGYGMSDDTDLPQTVEQIVNDYRSALKNKGLMGPYVLIAHEFGGVYASYWSLQYPDEVEGIIYLDGTEIIDTTTIQSVQATNADKFKSFLYQFGFQRLIEPSTFSASLVTLSQEEFNCSQVLYLNSTLTRAYLSERALAAENFATVKSMLKSTDIPKLYVSSKNSFIYDKDVIKYYEYRNEVNAERNLPPYYALTDNVAQVNVDVKTFINDCAERYKSETAVFAAALGNCKLVRMPGDDRIYEQKPDGLVDVIEDFISCLNGEDNTIKSYYDDMKAIKWEQYAKAHQEQINQQYTTPVEDED